MRDLVNDVEDAAMYGDDGGERQATCPAIGIVVAAHRSDRRQSAQAIEHAGIADVAGVNDVVGAAQQRHGFRAQQSVSIGDEADAAGLARARHAGAQSMLNSISFDASSSSARGSSSKSKSYTIAPRAS